MSSAEKMRRMRARLKEDPTYKAKEKKRLAELHKRKRESLSVKELENLRKKDRDRKRLERAIKKRKIEEPPLFHVEEDTTPYKCKQTLSKAVLKTMRSLPKSIEKQKAVVLKLAKRLNLNITNELTATTSAPQETLDHYTTVKDFFFRSDVVYTCPGMNDYITVWENGVKAKLQKHYLCVYLREAYYMFREINPNFEIGFSKFCSLRPKNVLLLKEMPTEQCKCKIHENFILKLKAMQIDYSNDFWVQNLCDSSRNSCCWQNVCETCSNGKNISKPIDVGKTVIWKEWRQNAEGRLQLLTNDTSAGELYDIVVNDIPEVLNHVNLKRIQAENFQKDKLRNSTRIIQIDFAMSFCCEYQNEIQSALWSRSSVLLFTVAVFYKNICKTFIFCSDHQNKDKDTIYVFLHKLFEILKEDELPAADIIWSDGPSSEFKNRYMVKLLSDLCAKHNHEFYWKYFATSHGKGVVDGIGGNVKRLVRQKIMSQSNEALIIQSAEDFAKIASQLVEKTKIIYVSSSEILEIIKTSKPWENVMAIKGISKFHEIHCCNKEILGRHHCLSDKINIFKKC